MQNDQMLENIGWLTNLKKILKIKLNNKVCMQTIA